MKILQIIQANDYVAVYTPEKGSVPCKEIPLVCWALVEHTGYGNDNLQEVIGMEEDSGKILLSPTKKNFIRYRRRNSP